MNIIEDPIYIDYYYNKYNLSQLFSHDVKKYMLFFQYEQNEYLCEDEKNMTHLMFVVKGKAKVCRTLENGKSLLLCFCTPLQILGDAEIVNERPASSTTQVLSECYVLAIPMEIARKELSTDPKFLKFICHSLSEKLSAISLNSSINLLYPLENRLASYINAVLLMEKEEETPIFCENLTHLAELLGTSYRHLLRTVKELCNQGILKKVKNGYQVTERQKLLSLAGDLYQEIGKSNL